MKTVYLAIGSNLNNPVAQALDAINALKTLPNSQFLIASSLYVSTPMGPQDQPDYINAVVAIKTDLPPLSLLDHTQHIELQHGRVRKEQRWTARTLDIDILLYGDEIIDSPRLTIPHYGMKTREFVLYPLAEIASDLIFPDGQSLTELLSNIPKNGLSLWSAPSRNEDIL